MTQYAICLNCSTAQNIYTYFIIITRLCSLIELVCSLKGNRIWSHHFFTLIFAQTRVSCTAHATDRHLGGIYLWVSSQTPNQCFCFGYGPFLVVAYHDLPVLKRWLNIFGACILFCIRQTSLNIWLCVFCCCYFCV